MQATLCMQRPLHTSTYCFACCCMRLDDGLNTVLTWCLAIAPHLPWLFFIIWSLISGTLTKYIKGKRNKMNKGMDQNDL